MTRTLPSPSLFPGRWVNIVLVPPSRQLETQHCGAGMETLGFEGCRELNLLWVHPCMAQVLCGMGLWNFLHRGSSCGHPAAPNPPWGEPWGTSLSKQGCLCGCAALPDPKITFPAPFHPPHRHKRGRGKSGAAPRGCQAQPWLAAVEVPMSPRFPLPRRGKKKKKRQGEKKKNAVSFSFSQVIFS